MQSYVKHSNARPVAPLHPPTCSYWYPGLQQGLVQQFVVVMPPVMFALVCAAVGVCCRAW
jgi:hypothetical protein